MEGPDDVVLPGDLKRWDLMARQQHAQIHRQTHQSTISPDVAPQSNAHKPGPGGSITVRCLSLQVHREAAAVDRRLFPGVVFAGRSP